jgi:hypothetical protein
VLTVHDLPADQTFVLDGFLGHWYPGGVDFSLHLRDNRGQVRIGPITYFGEQSAPFVKVERCANVTFNNCCLQNVLVDASTVVFTECELRSTGVAVSPYRRDPFAGLECRNSTIVLAECDVFAGFGGCQFCIPVPPAPPGILMEGGTLYLAGTDQTRILCIGPVSGRRVHGGLMTSQGGGTSYGAAIHSDNGRVVIDSAVQLANPFGPAPPTAGSSTFTFAREPFVLVPEILADRPIQATVYGDAGSRAWLLMSRAVFPTASPFGELWLDPTAMCLLGSGVLAGGQGSHRTLSFAYSPFVRQVTEGHPPWGEAFAFQALVDDGTRMRLSLPVVATFGARAFAWRF